MGEASCFIHTFIYLLQCVQSLDSVVLLGPLQGGANVLTERCSIGPSHQLVRQSFILRGAPVGGARGVSLSHAQFPRLSCCAFCGMQISGPLGADDVALYVHQNDMFQSRVWEGTGPGLFFNLWSP